MSLQENWKEEHTSGSPVCFAGPGGSLRGPVGKASIVLRLVITFLPRSKRLLIAWLQLTICSDFGAQKNKV